MYYILPELVLLIAQDGAVDGGDDTDGLPITISFFATTPTTGECLSSSRFSNIAIKSFSSMNCTRIILCTYSNITYFQIAMATYVL